MSKILIVEDDGALAEELAYFLGGNGYETDLVKDFSNTLEYMEQSNADLILLDINLPYVDGQSLLRMYRRDSKTPVIIVTSKDTEMDELICMSIGADDFVTKPYNPTILLLHIEAVLRRYSENNDSDRVKYGKLTLNLAKSTVSSDDSETEFTKNEFGILLFLVKNKGRIVSRDEIMNHLWDSCEFVDDNTLTVNIARVRHKLSGLGQDNLITTKRGQGYYIEAK